MRRVTRLCIGLVVATSAILGTGLGLEWYLCRFNRGCTQAPILWAIFVVAIVAFAIVILLHQDERSRVVTRPLTTDAVRDALAATLVVAYLALLVASPLIERGMVRRDPDTGQEVETSTSRLVGPLVQNFTVLIGTATIFYFGTTAFSRTQRTPGSPADQPGESKE